MLAPGFDNDALRYLTTTPPWRNSVRLIDLRQPIGPDALAPAGHDLRRIEGGLLVQEWDSVEADPASGAVATGAGLPTPSSEISAFMACLAMVKSNAIVLAKDGQLVGVGAGR